jgi:hypothetical protein
MLISRQMHCPRLLEGTVAIAAAARKSRWLWQMDVINNSAKETINGSSTSAAREMDGSCAHQHPQHNNGTAAAAARQAREIQR